MRILVPGANGQVGKNLLKYAKYYSACVVALNRQELDISDANSVARAFEYVKPDLVINAAAYTSVDRAQSEPELVHAINVTGPRVLAEACARADIPLIHISTDYVFDGELDRPYIEDDFVNPRGVYSVSKEAGERSVREILDKHIILRTSWIFSEEGACFPKAILRAAKDRSVLKVVNDQLGGPTSAVSIAKVLLHIGSKVCFENKTSLSWGTFHFSQYPYVTWYEFASKVVELGKESGIISETAYVLPCASDAYPTLVKRPKNSRLNSEKVVSSFGISKSDWRLDLANLIAQEKN